MIEQSLTSPWHDLTGLDCIYAGTKRKEVSHPPPNPENLAFHKAKMVVYCTPAGQLTVTKKKKVTKQKFSQGSLWHPLKIHLSCPCT